VARYLRVSTEAQTVENQRRESLAVCERRGWHVVAEFCDNGVSGAKVTEMGEAYSRKRYPAHRIMLDLLA
jgi:DNA invertase Pin-like site-specific DNA recombinase